MLRSSGFDGYVCIFTAIDVRAITNSVGPIALDCGWLCWIWGPYNDVGTLVWFGRVVN